MNYLKSLEELYSETRQELSPQEVSNNYFVKMTEAYHRNLAQSPSEISQVFHSLTARNKTVWWTKVIDTFKNPLAAIEWGKTWLFATFGENWFTKLLGVNAHLLQEKSKIYQQINIPLLQTKKILASFDLGIPVDASFLEIQQALQQSKLAHLDPSLILAIVSLRDFIKQGSHSFSNLSVSERFSEEFWRETFNAANIAPEIAPSLLQLFLKGNTVIHPNENLHLIEQKAISSNNDEDTSLEDVFDLVSEQNPNIEDFQIPLESNDTTQKPEATSNLLAISAFGAGNTLAEFLTHTLGEKSKQNVLKHVAVKGIPISEKDARRLKATGIKGPLLLGGAMILISGISNFKNSETNIWREFSNNTPDVYREFRSRIKEVENSNQQAFQNLLNSSPDTNLDHHKLLLSEILKHLPESSTNSSISPKFLDSLTEYHQTHTPDSDLEQTIQAIINGVPNLNNLPKAEQQELIEYFVSLYLNVKLVNEFNQEQKAQVLYNKYGIQNLDEVPEESQYLIRQEQQILTNNWISRRLNHLKEINGFLNTDLRDLNEFSYNNYPAYIAQLQKLITDNHENYITLIKQSKLTDQKLGNYINLADGLVTLYLTPDRNNINIQFLEPEKLYETLKSSYNFYKGARKEAPNLLEELDTLQKLVTSYCFEDTLSKQSIRQSITDKLTTLTPIEFKLYQNFLNFIDKLPGNKLVTFSNVLAFRQQELERIESEITQTLKDTTWWNTATDFIPGLAYLKSVFRDIPDAVTDGDIGDIVSSIILGLGNATLFGAAAAGVSKGALLVRTIVTTSTLGLVATSLTPLMLDPKNTKILTTQKQNNGTFRFIYEFSKKDLESQYNLSPDKTIMY